MIKLKMTCPACPEQYDAFDEDGKMVGYLRLRHGHFTVHCPDYGGTLVYEADPEGDGAFDPDERDYYLRFAVDSIEKWISNPRYFEIERPPPPDVSFTIEDDDLL